VKTREGHLEDFEESCTEF